MISQPRVLLFTVMMMLSSSLWSQAHQEDFKELNMLNGLWKMQTKSGYLFEMWQIDNDSTLKSCSYILKDQDTSKLETANLILRSHVIIYVPVVNGQNDNKPVIFKLISSANGVYIFENKEHDFPQRVVYELPHHNHLHAWIEGNEKGQLKKINYNYELVH